jgi:uncharacterized protein (UPF0262 family)
MAVYLLRYNVAIELSSAQKLRGFNHDRAVLIVDQREVDMMQKVGLGEQGPMRLHVYITMLYK